MAGPTNFAPAAAAVAVVSPSSSAAAAASSDSSGSAGDSTIFEQYKDLPLELKARVLGFVDPVDYPRVRGIDRVHRDLIDQTSIEGTSYRRYLLNLFVFLQKKLVIDQIASQIGFIEVATLYTPAVNAFIGRKMQEILAPLVKQVFENLQYSIFHASEIDNLTLLKMINYAKDSKMVAAQAILSPMLMSSIGNTMQGLERDHTRMKELFAIKSEAEEMEKKEAKKERDRVAARMAPVHVELLVKRAEEPAVPALPAALLAHPPVPPAVPPAVHSFPWLMRNVDMLLNVATISAVALSVLWVASSITINDVPLRDLATAAVCSRVAFSYLCS